tara:strand:+ start:210 stop:467 length:258 start_codon:yes stop_codon:yes gene_type:complete
VLTPALLTKLTARSAPNALVVEPSEYPILVSVAPLPTVSTREMTLTSIVLAPPLRSVLIPVIIPLRYPVKPVVVPSPATATLSKL